MLRYTDPIDWRTAGGRVKTARRKLGLTQKELAEPVISPSFLSLIESGARQPSPQVLEHLSAKLGVQAEELLLGYPATAPAELELKIQEARRLINSGETEPRQLLEEVHDEAQRLNLTETQARCLEVIGGLELSSGAVEDAMDLFRKAEELWSGAPIYQRFETVVGIARCLEAQGSVRRAIHELESYLLALERQEMAQPTALLRVNSALVALYSAMGMADLAAEAAERALALTLRVEDPMQIACMNMNVAESLLAQGRITDALGTIREAERMFLTVGWQRDAARARLNRGIVELESGNFLEAEEDLRLALGMCRDLDDRDGMGKALNELGRSSRLRGDVEGALDKLREAQQYLSDNDATELALNQQEFGLCIWASDGDRAKDHFRAAIELLTTADLKHKVALTYALLGDLQRELGEIAESADSYRAGITTATSAT